MRWTKLALICVAALTAFFVAVHQVNGHMVELRAREETLTSQLSALVRQQEELTEEISQVGTESYIMDRARSDYQYVNPGELRFEIVNPGALYDEDTAQIGAGSGSHGALNPSKGPSLRCGHRDGFFTHGTKA